MYVQDMYKFEFKYRTFACLYGGHDNNIAKAACNVSKIVSKIKSEKNGGE